MIDGARSRGLDVTTEVYPYTAASTYLQSALFEPAWQERFSVGFGDVQWPATGERLTADSFIRYRKQGGLVVIHMIPETSVRAALSHPHVMVGSDGVPGRVIDRAAYERPAQYSEEIRHVLVGGTFVVRDETVVDGVATGRAIRSPQ